MIEAFKEKMKRPLKINKKNTIKQVKEMNEMVEGLKMEIETLKKTQTEGILEMENLEK